MYCEIVTCVTLLLGSNFKALFSVLMASANSPCRASTCRHKHASHDSTFSSQHTSSCCFFPPLWPETKRRNNPLSLCPKPGVHYYLMRASENDTHLNPGNQPCLCGTGLWHCLAGAPGRRRRSAARLHSGLAWVERQPCCSDISPSCPKVLPLLVDWCPLR